VANSWSTIRRRQPTAFNANQNYEANDYNYPNNYGDDSMGNAKRIGSTSVLPQAYPQEFGQGQYVHKHYDPSMANDFNTRRHSAPSSIHQSNANDNLGRPNPRAPAFIPGGYR
jgi:hypothetical protein